MPLYPNTMIRRKALLGKIWAVHLYAHARL
jgi:hypothetical protein